MLYMSNDKKRVFDTEQECCEYEQQMERERVKNERLEAKRQEKINVINKKYQELQELISEYENEYGIRQKPYFAPVYELVNMLCR